METIKLVLASNNAHKIEEVHAILSEYLDGIEILSLGDIGFECDIEENGSSFMENALIKANAVLEKAKDVGAIPFADDSGLVVPALGGAPGIYSARYAGGHGNDAANRALLLENLKGNPDRRAAFVCAIAAVLPFGEPITVHGAVEGEILCAERGKGGFGYDCLFWHDGYGKSFAELSAEEKNLVSHRRRALYAFADELGRRFGRRLKNT